MLKKNKIQKLQNIHDTERVREQKREMDRYFQKYQSKEEPLLGEGLH